MSLIIFDPIILSYLRGKSLILEVKILLQTVLNELTALFRFIIDFKQKHAEHQTQLYSV